MSLCYFLAQNRRYLVYANGLCAAYSLVSAFYTAVPRPATLSRSWIVFLLDQVIHCFLSSAFTTMVRTIFCSLVMMIMSHFM